MPEKPESRKKLDDMLLHETVWKIEDKMNIMLESIADHEAELIRLKRLINLSLQRLARLESQASKRITKTKNE